MKKAFKGIMSKISPDEQRQRRLNALGGNNNNSTVAAAATERPSPPTENTAEEVETASQRPIEGTNIEDKNAVINNDNNGTDSDEDEDLKAALALSLQEHKSSMSLPPTLPNPRSSSSSSSSSSSNSNRKTPMTNNEQDINIHAFHDVMWDSPSSSGGVGTTEEDQLRWISQGILFSADRTTDSKLEIIDETNSSTNQPNWGLVQNHGGPCGVLAAIQGEVLKILIFESNTDSTTDPLEKLGKDEEERKNCLALAMARILVRAALAKKTDEKFTTGSTTATGLNVAVVLPSPINGKAPQSNTSTAFFNYKELSWGALNPWPWGNAQSIADDDEMRCTRYPLHASQALLGNARNVEQDLTDLTFQFIRENIQFFHAPGGVMLFVMSMVETRGADVIKDDMDDPSFSHLTSQFGHCSQELLNLLLTGQATTNVFDNTVNMSGLIIHGISQRPTIGYLSQLESLRYCTVGTFYKTPTFPVWVIGSQSHFTVLFSQKTEIIMETESESILGRCRRVFKSIDGAEENGFIQVTSLGTLVKGLDLEQKVGGESGVSMLAASLEVSGAGIILWDDFWRIAGRLMTGATLESVLQGGGDGSVSSVNAIGGAGSIISDNDLNVADSTITMSHDIDAQTARDEEVARRLAAELGSSPIVSSTPQPKSDEELARELQAKFDAENSNGGLANITPASNLFGESITQPDNNQSTVPNDENRFSILSSGNGKESDVSTAGFNFSAQQTRHNMEFEKFGDTFSLHHYNGLRGGILTTFKITKLSPEEAVGASVALSQRSANNAGGPQERGRKIGDLEDVVRTRWPSCAFNWDEADNNGEKMGVSLID